MPLVWFTVFALAAFALVGGSAAAPSDKERTAPTTPTNLRVTAATATTVTLAWDPSQDDSGVAGYYVYGDRGKATVDRNLDKPQYTVNGLACGQSVQLSVIAFDASQNRSERATATASASPCLDTQPPSSPSGFTQAATSQDAVVLVWNASSDNVGVVGYAVYRNLQRLSSPTDPAATLSGLSCGSSYVYTVDAVDAAGNRSPLAMTYVRTSACPTSPTPTTDTQAPSVPSGLAASSIAQTSLTLSWNASSDNVGVTGYDVYRDGTKVATPTSTSTSLSGLTCGTSYAFAVQARDAAGNVSSQAKLNVSTAACSTSPSTTTDTQAPSVPSGLAASSIAQTSLTLSWNASSDNVGVTGYDVYRDGTRVASPATTSASLTGLACATSYGFAVQARDAAGNLSSQTKLTVSTAACSTAPPPADSSAPSQPTGFGVAGATRTSVGLFWNASTDNVGVVGYQTYLNDAPGATTTETGATIGSLACGTAYTFAVDAFDAVGNHSGKAVVTSGTAACADTQAPTAPANVVATSRTATSIALNWSASNDNVGVTGYGLYRGGSSAGTTSTTTGIFSGLACGTNYTLGVDAYDAAGNRSSQTVVMVSTTACADTTAPSVPTGLVASNVTQTGLALGWNASSDNVGVTGYDVYRNGTKVATVTSTAFSQSGLTCGTAYTFGVIARDAAGNSSGQASVQVTTAACSISPSPSTSSGPITITTGGTYSGNWTSTTSTPAVTVSTSQPVTIVNSTVTNLAGGALIDARGSGVQLTVDHVTANGGDTYQTSGRFILTYDFKSLVVRSSTITNTRGIEVAGGVAGSSVLITRNRHKNIQGNATNPVGNFVQFRDVQNATADVSWNEIINEYDKSYPEDIINIYKSAHVNVHDNMLWQQSRPGNVPGSTQGGITIDCISGSGCDSNTISNNQLVGTEAILTWVTQGGSNNMVSNNRIVNDGYLDNGNRIANGYMGIHVLSGGSNNHAHGNVVGYVNKDGARLDGNFEGAPEGDAGEWANNTHMSGSITQATEQAEWTRWQDKLSAAGIQVGA